MVFNFDSIIFGQNWFTLILAATVLILVRRLFFSGRNARLPPMLGYRLPVFGHLLRMESDARKPFRKFRKNVGEIYSMYFGNQLVIVLASYDVIKEVLIKRGDTFVNRPYTELLEKVTRGLGIANTNGPLWKDHRRFILSTLKDFGMGKSVLQQKINEEVKECLSTIAEYNGTPFDPKHVIPRNISNIINSITFGKTFKREDLEHNRLIELIDENMANGGLGNILQFIPLLKILPGDLFKYKQAIRNSDEMFAFCKKVIDDHLKEFDENNITDFTSAYIKEFNSQKQSNPDTSFSLEQLSAVIADLFIAGLETTTTALCWSLALLANYSEIQERMYTEIRENIGTKTPSIQDRSQLTYVEAFYMEVLRFCNLTTLTIPRAAVEDTELRGYAIPKEAILLPDFDSVFTDEKIWGDPETFRPDRFLDENGRLSKQDEYIPFSAGKRNCIGESLAKMELFLFLASVVQKFRLECPKGEDVSMETIDGSFGFVHAPKPYRVIAIARK